MLTGLAPSEALTIQRYSSIEDFETGPRLVHGSSIPLDLPHFTAQRAILVLPTCRIELQSTFPRMFDAYYDGPGLLVMMSFHQASSPQLHLNGVIVDDRSIAIARPRTSYFVTETAPAWQAFVRYSSDMDGRGWPATSSELSVYRIDHAAAERMRLIIQAIFSEASALGPAFRDAAAQGAEESLTSAIDASFATSAFSDAGASLVTHVQLMRKVDEIGEASPSSPIYSDRLARELGTSIRTLHTAALNVRGMTLHQYLRTKRLWAVRKELMSGEPIRIKASALAHGFWHLGEFAIAYRKLFGERPSETYARTRRVRA